MENNPPPRSGAHAERRETVYCFSPDANECAALSAALAAQGFRCASAQSLDALLQLIQAQRPDAVIVDFESGVRASYAIGLVRSVAFGVRVFVIGPETIATSDLISTVRAGAVAVFARPLVFEHVVQVVSSDLRPAEISAEGGRARAPKRLSGLSDRELEVLRLVADGNSNKRIAIQLDLSPRTIEAHRASMIKKLGVPNTAAMIRLAIADR